MQVPAPGGIDRQEEFLSLLSERLKGFATYLGCGDDAPDVAQETLIVLQSKYPDEQNPEDLVRIANRICRNLAANHRRRLAGSRSQPLSECLTDAAPTPEQLLLAAEARRKLLEAIKQTSGRDRIMLELQLAGAQTPEICAATGLTPERLYVQRTRFLQRVRRLVRGVE